MYLPERNVINVSSIIQKDGITYNNIPTYQEFLSPVGKWYEVPALAESTIFVPDPGKPTDKSNIKVGRYITTNNRFITEFTPENFMKLTFGGGNTSANLGVDLSYQNLITPGFGLGIATGYNHYFGKNATINNVKVDNNDFGVIPVAALFRVYPKQTGFYFGAIFTTFV